MLDDRLSDVQRHPFFTFHFLVTELRRNRPTYRASPVDA